MNSEVSALYIVFLFVAAFVAVVGLAMVVVFVRNCLSNGSEVTVLSTVPPPEEMDVPPTRLGQPTMLRMPTELRPQTQQEQQEMAANWALQAPQPAWWRPVGAQLHRERFVTFVIRHAVHEMMIVVEIKEWRTVFMLLFIVQRETQIPVVDLSFRGRTLQENRKLRECGFKNGDCVELTLSPRIAHVSL